MRRRGSIFSDLELVMVVCVISHSAHQCGADDPDASFGVKESSR